MYVHDHKMPMACMCIHNFTGHMLSLTNFANQHLSLDVNKYEIFCYSDVNLNICVYNYISGTVHLFL